MTLSRNQRILAATCLLLALSVSYGHVYAQINNYILNGNQQYDQHNYKAAQDDYLKALKKDPNNTAGLFNLGNTLYQQKQYDSSRKVMAATANASKNNVSKAAANYNIGNTYMSQQKWEDAENAYKQTLRNNPNDVDAKYNLSYAEQMMKKNQDKNNKDKNKQNKDQQKQKQQNKDNKDNKNKQDKGQNNQDQKNDKDKDQQQPQGQPSKLSQDQADQLLNALQNEEKKLQDKMKKEKGATTKLEKDW